MCVCVCVCVVTSLLFLTQCLRRYQENNNNDEKKTLLTCGNRSGDDTSFCDQSVWRRL